MGIQKLAHAELRVKDLEKALEFYKEVMGLVEVAREGQTVYLACGVDGNYDLAVTPGGTGVAHFAFQVDDEADLETCRRRLEEKGVKVSLRNGTEPGQDRGISFHLPSGHTMELVLVADRPHYLQPALARYKRFQGFAPLDADHITLQTRDVKGLAEFLRDVLGFYISDVFSPAPGIWGAAWTRVGEYHHDLAIIGTQDPNETLNHLAWTMDGFEHVKKALDLLAQYGLPVETGPGRHGVGGNVFAYFWEPGGNRFELSAEMPRAVDRRTGPIFWDDFPKAFSSWGQLPPESFAKGS